MSVMLPTLRRGTRRPRAGHRVALLGIGTTAAKRVLQSTAAMLTEPLCCDTEQQRQFLQRVYAGSGIHTRSSVLLADEDPEFAHVRAFYRPRATPEDLGPTTSQRMALYAQHAPQMALSAARRALESAAVSPEGITHLIPVTCTGFFAPGLDAHLIKGLGLRPEIGRVQLGFMGCHGAFNALAAAMQIAAGNPDARVLVCCVELCTLHLAYGFDPQKLVANALFADGAAAAIVGQASRGADEAADRCLGGAASGGCTEEAAGEAPAARVGRGARPTKPLLYLQDASSLLVPDSLDAMTWRIGDHGFAMTLSPRVPGLIGQHVPAWITGFLKRHHLTTADIAHHAIHPGGPKILTACADALGFSHEHLCHSRQVLHDYGNMSSATILFVLEALLAGGVSGPVLALGFGPGLMAEAMLLKPGGDT